ncbi:pilus assembly protein PilP [Malonomonas rubra]|uniref:pilus assembly protein PilP n=1 Tax=Malonomonas rubra TaxID=57040 RepID=UPI0026EBCA33|nr:pilus assembly protein PilP [Malonomonas rubra]
MRQQPFLLILFIACGFLVVGCEKEQPPAPSVSSKTSAKPPVASVGAPKVEEEQSAPAETKFVYQIEGRRDPFVPLVATKRTAEFFENPLEAFDVQQFMVKAVIVGMGETKAMVISPDGSAYILKVGMRLGKANGVIKEVNRERIVVEEQYQDITGKVRKNIQELKVPVREGV